MTHSFLRAVLIRRALEEGWLKEDREAHLDEGREEEDEEEADNHAQLINVLIACPFYHLLDVQDVVSIP